MPNRILRLALGQMRVEGGEIHENLDRAAGMIRAAATGGCQMVVLPECLDVGWTHPAARDLAKPIPGPSSDALSAAATKAGIHVVAGLTERVGKRVYNAAVLIAPDGRILLKHRKINVLDIAQDLYSIGDRLGVAHTPLGTIGVNICADNFPDSLVIGHALARMGAEILLSPSAWAVLADHDPTAEPYGDLWRGAYKTLATLYEIPVVGVSNVGPITGGPWQGRKCIGCSLAVAGDGRVVAEGPYGDSAEALIPVELELTSRRVAGTEIAASLRAKGYHGP